MSKKLLIITQVMDTHDPVLGFFHEWVIALAPYYASLEVICLKEGTHNLPTHVHVHSLGKEQGKSRFTYLWRFYRYAIGLRHSYDSVFIHMNEEYAILGGLLWTIMRKPVYMWRNFHKGTWRTDLAAFWCTGVFCTSRSSYTARYKKAMLMPVGVDTTVFSESNAVRREPRSILSLGRIAPVKRIHVLLKALHILAKEGITYTADIYGNALPQDESYRAMLLERVKAYGLSGQVHFYPGVPNTDTPAVFQAHDVFVNLSPSGMYDKTIFESAAMGTLSVASSLDYAAVADSRLIFADADPVSLADSLRALLTLSGKAKESLREESILLAKTQDLGRLAAALAATL